MDQHHKLSKRLFDVITVVVFLPLLLVLYGLIALIVRITSGSPVIFRQERAGRNGKPFTIYKFRTMKTDINPYGPSPHQKDDPRLTKIGKILRKFSLDELPQFINVLQGDMSLVGPRPLYVSQIPEWTERQKRRLLVKPGLTGLAQISGRASLTVEEKLELDLQYVENQSFWLDLKILFATVFKVLKPADIYEKRYSKDRQRRDYTHLV